MVAQQLLKIDIGKLNPLEKRIHSTLLNHCRTTDPVRITEAAKLCNCSPSKISKLVVKIGFENYKHYLAFLNGKQSPTKDQSSELLRLKEFIDALDHTLVQELAAMIADAEQLVLFGYGPSYLCAQYFEYRFKTCTNFNTVAAFDEVMANSLADDGTLLIVFTTTGSFGSFEDLYDETKAKGGRVVFILEELNIDFIQRYDKVLCMNTGIQQGKSHPYEKTRTTFFIFMEEVMQALV